MQLQAEIRCDKNIKFKEMSIINDYKITQKNVIACLWDLIHNYFNILYNISKDKNLVKRSLRMIFIASSYHFCFVMTGC